MICSSLNRLRFTASYYSPSPLRIIDDIGLTTHAPDMASFAYWRQVNQKGQNSMCPCWSGEKGKTLPLPVAR